MSKLFLLAAAAALFAVAFLPASGVSADAMSDADIDGDGVISILDITMVYNTNDPRSDVNNDGVSNGYDVIAVLIQYHRQWNTDELPSPTPAIDLQPTLSPPTPTPTDVPPTATATLIPAKATSVPPTPTATTAPRKPGLPTNTPRAATSTPTPTATPVNPIPPTPIVVPTSPPQAGTRDKFKQPFASTSIWNMPIGSNAQYVATDIQVPNGWGMTVDPDIIFMDPNAPLTPVYYNGDAWSGGTRCDAQGALLFNLPMPLDYVIAGASAGDTPNGSSAAIMAHGRTIKQTQPLTRCTFGGIATTYDVKSDVDIYGDGILGAHGGSGLSAIGGTIRIGELVPGGAINHAIKINLNAEVEFSPGYRWPAVQADSCSPGCYGGSNAALKPGALLALPASLDLNSLGLETEPAQMLAWTLQNYGGYVVDSTSWSVYAVETEQGPAGDVRDEFQSRWGFSMTPTSRGDAWSRDMDRIFGALAVVDNNSAGSIGGGGSPRVPLAPPIGN